MAEKKILIEKQEMTYEGLFDLGKLFLHIDSWIREHGYDKHEFQNNEIVTEEGKEVFLELRPWKAVSDYAKQEIRVRVEFTKLKEVEIERNGTKQKLLRGKAHFTFQARMRTDFEGKWEGTPMYQFIRTFVDKFIHKHQTSTFENECMEDCNLLREEIKAYLNLYRYKV